MSITNNRVLCFLAAHQLTEADIVRKQEDEQRTVTIGGETLPWTVHFVSWNSRHLREWAASLGFTRDYRLALVGEDGHDAYDSWLRARYTRTERMDNRVEDLPQRQQHQEGNADPGL